MRQGDLEQEHHATPAIPRTTQDEIYTDTDWSVGHVRVDKGEEESGSTTKAITCGTILHGLHTA